MTFPRNLAMMGDMETSDKKPKLNDILDTAMLAGHIMLENGAEIYRVEDTMNRISAYYGAEEKDFFVLSNGIFTTGQGGTEKSFFAHVQHIPVKGADLSKVVAVNQISREILAGHYTLEEAKEKLEAVRVSPNMPKWVQVLASAVGAACFCLLYGGGFGEAFFAGLSGLLLWIFVLYVSGPHLSKITGNILGGALVACICIIGHQWGFGKSMHPMIAGSIIPLIPGVAFINGIRDIGDGDYISGAVRLMDAILVFLCIAVGVGVVLGTYIQFFGGAAV